MFLILVGVAIWYGYHHYTDFTKSKAHSEVRIVNSSEHGMERIRVAVNGQKLVCERLANGETRTLEFEASGIGELEMYWEWTDALGERHWRGGMTPAGPFAQRHIIQVDPEGEIVYKAEVK
jgi:hypothetical protein